MGQGGYLTLVNGSPFDWTVNGQSSYQMPAWNWPTVPAGESRQVYVEWGDKGNIKDNAGEAYYSIATTDQTFQVQARSLSLYPPDFHLYIALDNLDTKTNNKGDRIDEGWRHDQSLNWILSQDSQGEFWTNSNPSIDWMHQSLPTIGNRKLKHVCMPGSHDAGMTEFHAGTIGATYQNTQTQLFNFYDQLIYGSRYFDVRPVLSAGEYVAGHYSEVVDLWFGGNGQSLSSTIDQINSFTATNKELIILKISHTLDTDNDFVDLSQDQWNRLFSELSRLNNRFIPSSIPSDLTNLKMNDFIANNAAVVIVSDLPNGISVGDYATKGFYSSSQFPYFDSYSNSDDSNTMQTDQLSKLTAERSLTTTDTKDKFFILSWTLTQQNPFGEPIVNLAVSVWDDLFAKAYSAFTPESYPNVLFLDAYAARDRAATLLDDDQKPATVPAYPDAAALAVAVNFGIASRNNFVTG